MFAYATLFVSAFLAATLIPLPSEVPLLVVVRSRDAVLLPVAVATLGNYLGACTTYALARRLFARRFQDAVVAHARGASLFRRYGAVTLLFSWVPVIGDAFVALAGAARIRLSVFSLYVALGKFARYAVVAYLASRA